MDDNNKIQVLPLAAPAGFWGLFVNDVCVRVFDNQGQVLGWACDFHFI